MRFSIETLEDNFKNIRAFREDSLMVKYSIYEGGSYKGDICYFKNNPQEIRVFVDNFPGKKKFFSTNIPFESIEEFASKMKFIGLDLEQVAA